MSGLDPKDLDQYDDAEPQAPTAAPSEHDSGIDVRIPTPEPDKDDTTLDDAQGDQGGCGRAEGAS